MRITEFERLSVGDAVLDALQDRIADWSRPLVQCNLLDGTLLQSVNVGTSQTSVAHGLSRTPVGWIITRKLGPGDVYEAKAPDNRFLYLVSTASVEVDLWVF